MVVVGFAAVLPAAAAQRQLDSVTTIRLVSSPHTTVVRDRRPKSVIPGEFSRGDSVSGTSVLFNSISQFGQPKGAVVGSDRYSIVVAAPPHARVTVTAILPGGTLRAVGPVSTAKTSINVPIAGPVSIVKTWNSIPIVGGTGVFAGARGTSEVRDLGDGVHSLNIYRVRLPTPPPTPAPPAPAPSDVQITNLWVCPGFDTHSTGADAVTGQLGRACNRDWGNSAFVSGTELVCSAEELNGSGQAIVMALLRGGVQLLVTPPGYRLTGPHWYSSLNYVWNPAIPSGSYVCQVRLDGAVAAQRSFEITQ